MNKQLPLVVIDPPHHRPPPQRIASGRPNHFARKPSITFATKSALSGHTETICYLSASLIGHSGSSAFRLSTTAVSMSLAGSRFSPESAPRPFHHGPARPGRGGSQQAP